jgi:hypothetical protein
MFFFRPVILFLFVKLNFQLPYSTKEYTEEEKQIILRERMLGHVEHIGGEVFGKLQIGGILSVGNQSSIAQNLASRLSARLTMVLSKEKAELRLHQSVPGSDFPCKNVNFRINLLDNVENQTDSLVTNSDTYKIQMTVTMINYRGLFIFNVFLGSWFGHSSLYGIRGQGGTHCGGEPKFHVHPGTTKNCPNLGQNGKCSKNDHWQTAALCAKL